MDVIQTFFFLHTVIGEVSISFWNLQIIVGLLIHDSFYDVVPDAFELIGVANDGILFLPSSCKYLFSAFHHLYIGDIKVSMTTTKR